MWKSYNQNTNEPAIYLKVDIFSKIKLRPKTREEQLIYRISVTNYVKLWTGVFDYDDIVNIMLESNKDIETEDQEGLLHAGLHILHNPQLVDLKEFTELDTGCLSVKLECLGPIILKMIFSLNVATADNFFYTIIRPLLIIADNQMHCENKLRQLLVYKERKVSKILTTFREEFPMTWYLRSEIYDDWQHMNRYNTTAKFWGKNKDRGVCPRYILSRKPLPMRPYDSEPVDINSDYPGPSGVATKRLCYCPKKINPGILKLFTITVHPSIIQVNVINCRQCDGAIQPVAYTVNPDESTSGSNNDATGPNNGTINSNDDAIEPNADATKEPNEDTSGHISDNT